MSVLTAFATYGIMNRRKPAKAAAPPNEPNRQLEQVQQQQPETKRSIDQVTAHNSVDGVPTSITVAIWPTEIEEGKNFPNPLSMDGPRLHPRQQNSDCALHALQMLLGGDRALLPSVIDLQTAKRHLRPAYGKPFDKSTVVQPSEFAEIYKRIIEIKVTEPQRALDSLNQLKRSNAANKLSLKEWKEHGDLRNESELLRRLELAKNVQKRAGNLEVHTFTLGQNDASHKDTLRAALEKQVGPRIILAKPLIDGQFGAVQEMLGFEDHYVSIELGPDKKNWVKRDPYYEKVHTLKQPDGEPVTNAYDAIEAELTWEKNRPDKSNTNLKKPTHIFIPTAK